MAIRTTRPSARRGVLPKAIIGTVAVAVAACGFGACSAIRKVSDAVHDIRGNNAIIDAFSTKLASGTATTFEATYVTTGSAPATVVYAVHPPKGVAFDDTPTGGTGDTTPVHIVVNSSGEFACSQSGSGAQWTCEKLGTADAATENEIFDFYTPSHWVNFLREFALAAGLAGDKVYHLHDGSGHPRLRQRRVRLRQLRDPKILDIAALVAVRLAARRHRHDDPDDDADCVKLPTKLRKTRGNTRTGRRAR